MRRKTKTRQEMNGLSLWKRGRAIRPSSDDSRTAPSPRARWNIAIYQGQGTDYCAIAYIDAHLNDGAGPDVYAISNGGRHSVDPMLT